MVNDQNGGGWPNFGPFSQIKFGQGVVGKTAPVAFALVCIFGIAIYALRDHPWLVFGLAIIVAAIVVWFVWRAFSYAEKHPNHAVLEGAELVRYAEVEQAAKTLPPALELEAAPSANTAPTQIGMRSQ